MLICLAYLTMPALIPITHPSSSNFRLFYPLLLKPPGKAQYRNSRIRVPRIVFRSPPPPGRLHFVPRELPTPPPPSTTLTLEAPTFTIMAQIHDSFTLAAGAAEDFEAPPPGGARRDANASGKIVTDLAGISDTEKKKKEDE